MQLFRTDRPLVPAWSLIGPSVRLVRTYIWQVFYLAFLPLLTTTIGVVLIGSRVDTNDPTPTIVWGTTETVGAVLALTGFLATILTFPGLIYLQLEAVKKKHPTALACFKKGLPKVLPLIGLVIIQAISIGIGFLLLIIPGLILLRKFYLAQYYVVDQNLGPIKALKASNTDSKPNAGPIWGVIGVGILFAMLGSFLAYIPVLGYLANIAVNFLYAFAPALRYSEITKNIKIETGKET